MLFLDFFALQMESHLHCMKAEVEIVTGVMGFGEVETYQFYSQPLNERLADFFWKGTDRNYRKLGRP